MINKRRDFNFWSEPVSALGIELYTCGEISKTGPDWISCGTAQNYAIICIAEGEGRFWRSKDVHEEVRQGDMFFLFPGVPYEYGPRKEQRWHEYWLNFNGSTIRNLHQCGFFPNNNPLIRPVDPDTALQRIDAFLDLLGSDARPNRLCGEFFSVLSDLLYTPSERVAMPSAGAIEQIAHAVRNDPKKRWNFQDEAQKAGMSYSLLRKRFAELYGRGPHCFLNHERMRLACSALMAGHTVKETAYYIGMEEPRHFSKLFKQIIGIIPREYRSSILLGKQ